MSSKKNLQKLLKSLQGKKKKKPTKPSARLEALRGKKFFRRGGKMRKKGAKGAPKASDFARAKQTVRKR